MTLAGATTYSNTFGTIPASGRTPSIVIAEAKITPDGDQIYIVGHAR